MNIVRHRALFALCLIALATLPLARPAGAGQTVPPSVVDPNLAVRTAASGFVTPVNMAFLGRNDMLVLEKNTGQVKRVVDGVVQSHRARPGGQLASERGLLGIALHPDFADNRAVYLYWTCAAPAAGRPARCRRRPSARTRPQLGADDRPTCSTVPLLGNRVDRFVWNGSTLTFDRNLIKLRAFQNDATNTGPRGNHDGGVIRFGPDGKLYVSDRRQGPARARCRTCEDGPFGPGISPTTSSAAPSRTTPTSRA